MHKGKILYLILIALGLTPFSEAQHISPKLPEGEIYTIEQGLTQTRINVSFIDSYGYLWIGTSDGLNRYDGYKFDTYRHQPQDTTSLSNNFIRGITEDGNKDLWVATNNGLNYFKRENGHFIRYLYSGSDSLSFKSPAIFAVESDEKGNIWVKTERHIERLDPANGSITSLPHFYDPNSPALLEVNVSIVRDSNGELWFGTKDGLFRLDPSNMYLKHYFHEPGVTGSLIDNQVRVLFKDRTGELWIGTSKGISKYDRINDRFIHYSYSARQSGDGDLGINSIAEDNSGTLWFAANNKLGIFMKRNMEFAFYDKLVIEKTEHSFSGLKDLVIDQSNIIWLGSSQGLYKIDLKPRKFQLYNSTSNSYPSLSAENVSAIVKDQSGRIWVGYLNNGIDIIDLRTGSLKNLSDKQSGGPLENRYIKSLYQDDKNRIWIGTTDGLQIYLPEKNQFVSFDSYFRPIPSNSFDKRVVYAISQDTQGNIWVGTDNGAYLVRENIRVVRSFRRIYNDSLSLEIGAVYSLASGRNNHIWLGTDNGVVFYDNENNIFYRIREEADRSGLLNSPVYALHFDANANLWVGTSYGLIEYNPEEESFKHFSEYNGLANNYIYAILEDIEGNIWSSTNKGLTELDPGNEQIKNYSPSDGLQAYEFSQGAAFSSSDGELFFGGIAGFNSFYPDEMPENPLIPNIVIDRFEIIGQAGIKDIHISKTDPTVIIKHNESFNIEFSALDFSYPSHNRFEYSLQEAGRVTKWIPLGTQNSVTFSNLNSGEYVFRVKGSNNDGKWNDDGTSLRIIVEAPFYRTRVAYFVYLITGILFVYLIIQIRTQSLRRSNKVLRERDIAAKEVAKQKELLSKRNKNIEDSLKYAQRIQMAMLMTPKLFRSILPNSFILHKPKDIVSGDFYWISEVGNKIFVAAIDCTGHGVPGAFMSLIGFELFRKIINMQKIFDPGKILNALNENFEEIFGKEEDLALRDGMDLSFCVLHTDEMVIDFAGAFNPLYIIRNNKLIEIKGNRFSVGADTDPEEPLKKEFISHRLKLEKEDMIYIFSDGYADQFGGPEGKKYKYRRFRHLLLTIHKLGLEKQKQYLEDSIEEWRGNFEQIDDILVIGIQPDFQKK